MRTPLLAANWKMFMLRRDAKVLVEDLLKECSPVQGREVLICPPAQLLTEVAALLQGHSGVHLGAQNCHWEEQGAFTGEISPAMIWRISESISS